RGGARLRGRAPLRRSPPSRGRGNPSWRSDRRRRFRECLHRCRGTGRCKASLQKRVPLGLPHTCALLGVSTLSSAYHPSELIAIFRSFDCFLPFVIQLVIRGENPSSKRLNWI